MRGTNVIFRKIKTLTKISIFIILAAPILSQPPGNNIKYNKWLAPSYFRGHNILYTTPKTLRDFIDFKNYGGNLFSININGFLNEDPPYDTVFSRIALADSMVNYCRQAGIHYVIAVRSGPGAYDTYLESIGQTPESRIWFTGSGAEQKLYSSMLKMIVSRYNSDSLFVGINVLIEPRPKVKYILVNNSQLYKFHLENDYNIHMDVVYSTFVEQIRTIDAQIPILLENFAYSTPELFPPYVINDSFIVYSTHDYQPFQYTRASVPFSVNYPGIYWNITQLGQVLYDSAFVANIVLGRLLAFQQTANKPIFIGEFGMQNPQNGGPDFIKDVLGTAKLRGWHFALWEWRGMRTGNEWSIEEFQEPSHDHWKAVLKEFHPPPVPLLISPANEETVPTLTPTFTWDSLTSYTKFDLSIEDIEGNQIGYFEDIINAKLTYSGTPLVPGAFYRWKVRSKNPGGTEENNSAWSEERRLRISSLISVNNNNNEIPREFKLGQNYPNPFNPATIIKYDLAKNTNVKICVYDVTGRLVKESVNEFKNAGSYSIEFNASMLSSGVYYYKITTDYFTDTKKMLLVK